MAAAPKMGPQDMPPPGGYGPIQIERIKLRKIISGKSFSTSFCQPLKSNFLSFFLAAILVRKLFLSLHYLASNYKTSNNHFVIVRKFGIISQNCLQSFLRIVWNNFSELFAIISPNC